MSAQGVASAIQVDRCPLIRPEDAFQCSSGTDCNHSATRPYRPTVVQKDTQCVRPASTGLCDSAKVVKGGSLTTVVHCLITLNVPTSPGLIPDLSRTPPPIIHCKTPCLPVNCPKVGQCPRKALCLIPGQIQHRIAQHRQRCSGDDSPGPV